MNLSFSLVLATIGLCSAYVPIYNDFPNPSQADVDKFEETDETPSGAVRFALPYPTRLKPANKNNWHQCKSKDGIRICCMNVRAKGAKSLNFGFTKFHPPEGTHLTLQYGSETVILGPDESSESDQYWTQIFETDEVEFCAHSPVAVRDTGIVLGSVNVGFRHVGKGDEKSGGCNVDVVCPERDGWEAEIAAAAGISYGGGLFCSGSMINNMESDGTPYFLTAYHCGVRTNNAPSMVAYWNFETSECDGTPDGSLDQFTSGATYLAGNSVSDTTLLRLNSVPDADYGVTYAGWDNTPEAYELPGVCIHHPSGDEKRISFENDPMSTTGYGGSSPNPSGTHVRVEDWDVGTTEPGSSGSPLYNGNHRIIGQLHGGSAACGNDLPDWYGRFSESWTRSEFSQWLDPNGNLGGGFGGVDTYDPLAFPTVSPAPTPVSSNVPSAPPSTSSSPTGACLSLELELSTDDWSSETSWDIKDPNGVVIESENSFSDLTTYDYEFCLPPQCSYTFTINDSYGDGICCSYGDGYYNLSWNNLPLVVEGGDFGGSESTEFGCPTCNENPDDLVVGLLNSNKAIFGTCGDIADNPQFIPSVCGLDPLSIASDYDPANKCPVTCGDQSATEDPAAEIFVLLDGPRFIDSTCGQLSELPTHLINFACNYDQTIWSDYVASSVCCDTCS